MPVNIDQINSEVQVESPDRGAGGSGGSGQSQTPLPAQQEAARWMMLARSVSRDLRRLCATDQDD